MRLEKKAAEQLKAQRVGYLLGVGAFYLNLKVELRDRA